MWVGVQVVGEPSSRRVYAGGVLWYAPPPAPYRCYLAGGCGASSANSTSTCLAASRSPRREPEGAMVEKTVGLACRALYFSEFQYWMTPQVKAMLMRAMACVCVHVCEDEFQVTTHKCESVIPNT